MVAEERHPARACRIWLGERPDQRVALIAEKLARHRMQSRDQLAGVALDARGDAAAVILDEVHDEEIAHRHSARAAPEALKAGQARRA